MSIETKVKIPHVCSPIAYDEYLDKILLALYLLGKAANSKEIVGKDSSLGDQICVGRAASFLSYLGLFKGERSHFEPSPSGRAIAIALAEGKKDVPLSLWQQCLKGHSLYSELQNYMKEQGGIQGTSRGFGEYLRKLAKKEWGTSYVKEGGKRLCILFANKGLLTFKRDEDVISFPSVAPPTPPPTPSPTPQPATPPIPPPTPTPTPPIAGVQGTLQYTINIAVEAKDAESIKQVIALIKELKGQKEET